MQYLKIDRTILDDYQLTELANAERLADEVAAAVDSVEVTEGDNGRADYRVTITHQGKRYAIRRDYRGEVSLYGIDKLRFEGVSSSTSSELRRAIFKSQNMRVITAKKLLQKIAEELEYNEAMQKAQDEHNRKHADFLASIEGMPFKLSRNYDSIRSEDGTRFDRVEKEITGGHMEKNGIVFTFELCQDGYISKKITLSYKVNYTLEDFQALADNKYTQRND